MTKLFTWLLYAVIAGCTAAPSAVPIYAVQSDLHQADRTSETDAIERVELNLKAVQATLAVQNLADIHQPSAPAESQSPTKGLVEMGPSMGSGRSMEQADQNQSNAALPQPAPAPESTSASSQSKSNGHTSHGMAAQSSMNMSAVASTAENETPSGPNTNESMKGEEPVMSESSMGAPLPPASNPKGTMGVGFGQGTASKSKGLGGMSKSKGMADMNMGSSGTMSGGSTGMGGMSKPEGMGDMNKGSSGTMSGGSMGMGGMSKSKGMGDMNMGSAGMTSGGSKGMCCGRMGSMMGKPTMSGGPTTDTSHTATGSAHVLHLGERDFYLGLQSELALTDAQVQSLTAHRDQWLAERANHQSAIDAAEARLWQLTQALTPNPDQVAAAVREVEQLRSSQRLAFIASVSEAVKTLTPAQIATARSLAYDDAP